MEMPDGSTDIVHPEVRAHITSLVAALGGFSAEDDGRYVLGDSALEVLKDIKRWIRFYDEKTNRMDVARCLAESNLVEGDLLHIIASWPENATENKFKARVALACYEILVPLTWPLERHIEEMTVNHHRHLPVLQLAQVGYKRAIINFDAAQILHTAVRVALPSLALPRSDRTGRDEGIIKLVLLFLRNIAMISPPADVKYEGDESQVSRSALIDAFSYQDILLTILTIASNMGEDFNQEGVLIMEIIFHLVKRMDVNKLFMEDKQLSKTKAQELTALMSKEAAMHRPHNRKAPTRHNRWGTMIWVQRDDGKMSTVSGQDALLDAATRQQKMDSSKTFRPPRRPRRDDMEPKDLGPPVSLNSRAREQLRGFVQEFLDSGFNPLFQHVRKKLDDQKEYVLEYHHRQFFYLVSWFLEAERLRKKAAKDSKKNAEEEDITSFNLVAGVLNQEMFITLNRRMGEALDNKNWPELCAAMRCFTQILLTVQEMSESGNEDDEEIAENILSRIFYEEETHERVATIARDYKDQGFEYLDACTELTHTYLRILEAYSKQNVDMQVRSRRRIRRKKKAAAGEENNLIPMDEDSESENDEAHAERTISERKFDFTRFANRFIPQGVVDTFVKFTKYYHDLDDTQLKRAHRYFYRVAFKQNMSVMLFRLDIIHLFYGMIKGDSPLNRNSTMYKEWEELVKQILKKCIRKIDERPALIIELLFSKLNATAHFLEYGFEKQTLSSSNSRPAAELEFKRDVEREMQIAIAVGALLDKEMGHHVKWVKEQLSRAESERKAWEAAAKAMASVAPPNANPVAAVDMQNSDEQTAEQQSAPAQEQEAPSITVRPDDDARHKAMFKNPHLRLLMKLVGFERLAPSLDETPDSVWIIPSHLTSDQLQDTLDLISKAEFDPPTFEDGALAEDQLRRKTAPRKKAVFDDDDDADDVEDFLDDGQLFPAGGPIPRKPDFEKPKKTIRRRRRRRNSDGELEPLTEEQEEERAKARREREREKAKRFKSDVYVHGSDDEDWSEERNKKFYANEERIRKMQQRHAEEAAKPFERTLLVAKEADKKGKGKRKADVLLGDDSDDDDDETVSGEGEEEDVEDHPMLSQSRASGSGSGSSGKVERMEEEEDDDDDDDGDEDETPPSSSPAGSTSSHKRRRLLLSSSKKLPASNADQDEDMADADAHADLEDDEDIIPAAKQRRRPRKMAGFIVDSSDDEE